MEELNVEIIKKRSIRGIFALTSRTFVIQLIAFASNFLLTIYLSPAIFGVYYVVTAALAFLVYFSDIGLAGALIQKKDPITDDELKTTFTIQQLLVICICLIAFFASSLIGSFYHLNNDGIILFRVLILSFFLSSLKTIPSILLERNLKFEKLVIPQIVENLFFYITAIILAIKGYGINAFTVAVLLRGISGVISIYIIQPWKIRVGFSTHIASSLLKFGVPYQTNSFLALIKDDLVIAYLGRILPLAQVGYIGFAQKWAFTPLRLIMDNVIRITFPSFSRLQHDKELLKVALEKSIFLSTFIIYPSLVGLTILSPNFVQLIPKYMKWSPALIALGFYAFNAAFAAFSTPLTNASAAIGKIKITLNFMIFWTILTWVLTPLMVYNFGFNGAAFASALVGLSSLVVVFVIKKYINFDFLKSIISPVLASSIMGIVVWFLAHLFVTNLVTLFITVAIGAILYFSLVWILSKDQLKKDIALVRSHLFS